MSGPHSIAVATACDDCAHLIGDPPARHGIRMTIIHEHHVPDLQALGWIYWPGEREPPRYEREPPEIVCPHYHAANWLGDADT